MAQKKHTGSSGPIDRALVRSALKSWHDLQKMGEHPLSRLKIVDDCLRTQGLTDTPHGHGRALRQILNQAIDALRPSDVGIGLSGKPWRHHLILKGQYVERRNRNEMAEQLCIAQTLYYEEQAAALDELTEIISQWEQCRNVPGLNSASHQTPFLAPPRPPYDLMGRAELLNALKQRLLSGGNLALFALTGLPGVGKTALAIELAHNPQIRGHFQDGVLWGGLGRQPDVLALLGAWGAALDIPASEMAKLDSVGRRAEAVHTAISLRRMLLVVDDAWQLEAALAFHVGGPNCAHLLTTRLPEVAIHFAGEGATIVHELSIADGARLLARLAPQAINADSKEAYTLAQMVGSLPLALTLIGNHLRVNGFGSQPRRIRAMLDRMRQAEERLQLALPQSPLKRQQSMPSGAALSLQASIALSDKMLDKASQLALRALAAFPPKPNTFSEEAALAVSAQPVEALDALSDTGLLESAGPGRYTLHQTIHDYAGMTPTLTSPPQVGGIEGGPRVEAEERMVEFFVRYVEAHATDYAALDVELVNVLAALQLAFERKLHADLVHGANALHEFLETRGLYTLTKTLLDRARQTAITLGDTTGLATTLLHLGITELWHSKYALAQEHLQASLGLARQVGDQRGMARTFHNLGNVSIRLGNLAEAQAYYQQAVSIYHEIGDRSGEGAVLNGLSNISQYQGDCAAAEAYCQQALRIYQEIGERRRESVLLDHLGVISTGLGDYAKSLAYLGQALDLSRMVGDRQSESSVINNLGVVFDNLGDYAKARVYLEQSLRITDETGDLRSKCEVLFNLGLIAHHLDEDQAACEYCLQALRIAQELGTPLIQGYALTYLGHALVGQERPAEAVEAYQQALSAWREVGQPYLDIETLAGLARVSMAQRELDQAAARVQEILGGLDANNLANTSESILIYLTCYRVLHATQDPRAQDILATAYHLLQERAAKISDEALQRSFLENVAAHREIVQEFEASQGLY